jgi:hypothetical protein
MLLFLWQLTHMYILVPALYNYHTPLLKVSIIIFFPPDNNQQRSNYIPSFHAHLTPQPLLSVYAIIINAIFSLYKYCCNIDLYT